MNPTVPTLTPAMRRAFPILAAAFDCFREPEPGEDFIDLTVGKESETEDGTPKRVRPRSCGLIPHRPTDRRNKKGPTSSHSPSPVHQQTPKA